MGTLENVTPMPSLMPGATMVSPTEGAMLRPSPTMVSPTEVSTEVSTEDGPMSTKEELPSSGLNCNTFKNLPRRIIQLPVLWIPKKLKVQNEYLLHIATA